MTADLERLTCADQPPEKAHLEPVAEPRPELPEFLRDHLAKQLRSAYSAFVDAPPPSALLDLIGRLETALSDQPASTFREDLLDALPALRAFAMSLTANMTRADDLVQETLLRAWQHQHRFTPGTNLNAWLFTILRNQFYSHARKRRREVEDADGQAAAQLVAVPDQEDSAALSEVWVQLGKLPARQREALLLIATQGLTYEAAAALLGCQTGTVKSRVSRARATLVQTLGFDASWLGRASAS